jgi:hypothetical protein
MDQRRWTIGIDWTDQGVCDTDEIVVLATSRREAEAKARQRWWKTNGAVWPDIRVCRVYALRVGGRPLATEN